MMRGLRGMLLVAALMGTAAVPVWAQATGQIVGTVRDATGRALAGVTVTVTGPALQGSLTQQTSERGTYQFPAVPAGSYTVTFVMEGFTRVSRQNPDVPPGFAARLDAALEPGRVTDEVADRTS